MIGVLLVTHINLAETMLANAENIVGVQPSVAAVSQRPGSGYQTLLTKVGEEIEKLDQGAGVIVLADVYGGSPAKASLSYVDSKNIAVISGVNLAMLLKVLEVDRGTLPLAEVARIAVESAHRSISHQGCGADSGEGSGLWGRSNEGGHGPQEIVTKVTVLNSLGLHMSTSAKLSKEASRFASELTLTKGDKSVNMKSTLGILMLTAGKGSVMKIRAVGDDARPAVDFITEMFANKFGEE